MAQPSQTGTAGVRAVAGVERAPHSTERAPHGGSQRAAALPALPAATHEVSFDALYVQRPRRWLVAILLAYALASALFAVITPAWQAPDEPAHYNYIKHIATTGTLPTLHKGDYDQVELLGLLAQGFPPTASVDGLRYESYQLPLYYLTAVPIYWVGDGSLLALRLFNSFLGFVSLIFLYLCLEIVFPNKPLIPLGATAFAAFLPMHVAVTGAVNNDVLAELLTMASSLVLLLWMRPYFYEPLSPGATPRRARPDDPSPRMIRAHEGQRHVSARTEAGHHDRNHLLLLGVLLGLGMLTKIYAYALVPMFATVIAWTLWRRNRTWGRVYAGVRYAGLMLLPAVVFAAPAWIRNMVVYSWKDPLALKWHDTVVAGQPTTASWIYTYGSMAYFERAFTLTFRSFWGVFGWLGVFMNERVYQAALFATAVIFLGLLWASVRLISGKPDTDMDAFQTTVIALFGILLVAVAMSYVWYNLKFVQHQGRYFFWGMLGIGTVVALAWREVLHPLQGTITGLLTGVLGLSLALGGAIGQDVDLRGVAIVLAMALFLLLQPVLLVGTPYQHPWKFLRRLEGPLQRGPLPQILPMLRKLAWASPFLLLLALDLWAPFAFILPQLAE